MYKRQVDAPEKIDLTNIMLDVYHGVKRLWWLLIGLIIICAVQSVSYTHLDVYKRQSIYISKKNRIPGSFLKSAGNIEEPIWN